MSCRLWWKTEIFAMKNELKEILEDLGNPKWTLGFLPREIPGEIILELPANNRQSTRDKDKCYVVEPIIPCPLIEGGFVSVFHMYSKISFEKGNLIFFKWGDRGNPNSRGSKPEVKFIRKADQGSVDQSKSNFEEKLYSDYFAKIDKCLSNTKEHEIKLEKLEEDLEYQRKKLQTQKKELDDRQDQIDNQLKIIEPYRRFLPINEDEIDLDIADFPENVSTSWIRALSQSGISPSQSKALETSYLISLLSATYSGSLVLLNGSVGVGKTNIVKKSAQILARREPEIIPVRPAWLDPSDLIGFFDPIKEVFRPSPFLTALKNSSFNKNKLSLICLDELNLAKIENYASDLLSALEYS
jgi:hypothetical protein